MTAPRTPGTRAKDSDRVDICQVLDSALADGQLSMAEHEHRVVAATNAATLGELQSLVADLQQANHAQSPVGQSSKLRRGAVVIAATAGLAVVIGGAIAWAVMSDSRSTTNTATAKPSAEAPHALATTAAAASSTPEDVPAVVLAPPGHCTPRTGWQA